MPRFGTAQKVNTSPEIAAVPSVISSAATKAASRITQLNNILATQTSASQIPHASLICTGDANEVGFGTQRHRVAVIGSGNWGTTIAKVVAENTNEHSDLFEGDVRMWVHEEEVLLSKDSKHFTPQSELSNKTQKLTTLINEFHENVKYLPDVQLPHNLIADPDLLHSIKDATILIFNMPHQFIAGICDQLKGNIVPYARAISCIKGVSVTPDGIQLFHETIGEKLGIFCGALSGANIANEVALEKFSETTIAYSPPLLDAITTDHAGQLKLISDLQHQDASGKKSRTQLVSVPPNFRNVDQELFKKLFHRPYFHVRVIEDSAGVSLGGALKNVVAIAAGFVDGMEWGDNAKAAVMRIGLLEMVKFGRIFFGKTAIPATFTEESCGIADLITSCSGGRNHRCAKWAVQRKQSIEEVEKTELNGQKLQGTLTAMEVNQFLKSQGMEKEFPLFTAVHNILQGRVNVELLPSLLD